MQTRTTSRPRLTPAILAFAVVDVAGMVLFATGAMWFANGQPLFVPGFPTGVVTAGASLVGGLLLMFWAASGILDGFAVSGFGAALIGSLIYSVLGLLIESALERLFPQQ